MLRFWQRRRNGTIAPGDSTILRLCRDGPSDSTCMHGVRLVLRPCCILAYAPCASCLGRSLRTTSRLTASPLTISSGDIHGLVVHEHWRDPKDSRRAGEEIDQLELLPLSACESPHSGGCRVSTCSSNDYALRPPIIPTKLYLYISRQAVDASQRESHTAL